MTALGYLVRFKGHKCSAVPTGLAREPLLFRARKNEPVFVAKVGDKPAASARLACARLIKRTEKRRFDLLDRKFEDFRATASGSRLKDGKRTRRGKRWKICPIERPDSALDEALASVENL